MELSEITHYKEMAVNAMTGHMPCTPDTLYDLGKALREVCEELERAASQTAEVYHGRS